MGSTLHLLSQYKVKGNKFNFSANAKNNWRKRTVLTLKSKRLILSYLKTVTSVNYLSPYEFFENHNAQMSHDLGKVKNFWKPKWRRWKSCETRNLAAKKRKLSYTTSATLNEKWIKKIVENRLANLYQHCTDVVLDRPFWISDNFKNWINQNYHDYLRQKYSVFWMNFWGWLINQSLV